MADFKKICWTDADVRCPFYISDDRRGRSIRCEGYCDGADMVSRFQSLSRREQHMGRFCVGRYEDCPVYRCIYENKYGEA